MTPEQGRVLLDLARAAIAEALGGPTVERPVHDGWLDAPAALFVTLHRHGELRGCIGSIEARESVFDEVMDKATAAAFHDPRMWPVQADELPALDIEVTLLHPLEPMGVVDEEDLLARLRPGVDGLVLKSRKGSALFLPSVWKQLPEPRAFVGALLHKAGLRRWPGDLQAFRFDADVFSSATVEV